VRATIELQPEGSPHYGSIKILGKHRGWFSRKLIMLAGEVLIITGETVTLSHRLPQKEAAALLRKVADLLDATER